MSMLSRLHRRKPSFQEIALAEIPVLYRVARRMASSDSDAEDLVGQTLLLGAKGWPNFDGRHPRSWLIQIMRNEHAGRMRKLGTRPETALDEVTEPSDEGFWEAINHRIAGEDILRELDRLPQEYRIVVALCDVEEMSYEEAAEALEIPIGTVRSRLFRGRRILRSKLVHLAPPSNFAPVAGGIS